MTFLEYCNYIFAVIFTLEFLIKLFANGVIKYFTNFWNILDVFIVCVSRYGCTCCVFDEKCQLTKLRSLTTYFYLNGHRHRNGQTPTDLDGLDRVTSGGRNFLSFSTSLSLLDPPTGPMNLPLSVSLSVCPSVTKILILPIISFF